MHCLRRDNPLRQIRRDHLEMAYVPSVDPIRPNLSNASQEEGIIDDAAWEFEFGRLSCGIEDLLGGQRNAIEFRTDILEDQ